MSEIVIAGNTSGSVTIAAPDVAGTTTLNLPATSGALASTASNNTFSVAQRGSITTLTDDAVIAMDMNNNNFFSVTLAGNRTLGAPSNIVTGQTGSIFITQDASGNRLLAYNSIWKFAGGVVPELTTTANAVDRLDYVVISPSAIQAVLSKEWL